MSQEYQGQHPLKIAKQAERDLNSQSAKGGHDASYDTTSASRGASDSSMSAPSYMSWSTFWGLFIVGG